MTSRLRGVVIKPVPHGANALSMNTLFTNIPPVKNPLELLAQVCQLDSRKVTCNIIESSFEDLDEPKEEVYGCKNGFVDTVIKAYSNHHHLVLRPDDLWIAILTQVNIYVNIHAEEFRDMFVRHEGRKDLTVRFAERSDMEHTAIADAHWGKFAYKMTELLAEHIRDPSLREWILPQFSTTTKTDQAVASIAMMATMKKYVHSRGQLGCGLPSVTLLGRKNDWEKLVEKVERLPSFGQECTIWHSLLVPVLRRFVASYEAPEAEETKEFWQKIAHCSGSGSGSTYLSGWITAFCFWDVDGNLLLKAGENLQVQAEKDTGEEEMIAAGGTRKSSSVLELDGARYHVVATNQPDQVPNGWAMLPITVQEYGREVKAVMVAGSVGLRASSSGEELHAYKEMKEGEKTGMDTVSVENGWWIIET